MLDSRGGECERARVSVDNGQVESESEWVKNRGVFVYVFYLIGYFCLCGAIGVW